MRNITFRQFMITYNFRYYNENGEGNKEKLDTSVIRIHYPTDKEENNYHWFEFGMYDYESDYYRLKHFEEIFRDNILNMYIANIYHNDRLNILEVYLTKDKKNDEI